MLDAASRSVLDVVQLLVLIVSIASLKYIRCYMNSRLERDLFFIPIFIWSLHKTLFAIVYLLFDGRILRLPFEAEFFTVWSSIISLQGVIGVLLMTLMFWDRVQYEKLQEK